MASQNHEYLYHMTLLPPQRFLRYTGESCGLMPVRTLAKHGGYTHGRVGLEVLRRNSQDAVLFPISIFPVFLMKGTFVSANFSK